MLQSLTQALRRSTARILLLGLLIASAPSTFAAVNSYANFTLVDQITNNSPALNLVKSQTGLVVNAANDAVITTAAGSRVTVPIRAAATISNGTLALNAAKIIRGANIVGAAFTAYEVYNWVKDSGVTTCAPPDFFCKPAVQGDAGVILSYCNSNPGCTSLMPLEQAYKALQTALNSQGESYTEVITIPTLSNPMVRFYSPTSGQTVQYSPVRYGCTNGNTPQFLGGTYTCGAASEPSPPSPYGTQQELADAIAASMGAPSADTIRLHDALRKDMQKLPGIITPGDIVPPATPLTVTAPEVSTPPAVTKTETITQPDGSKVVRETSSSTTIVPNIPWTKIGDAATTPATFKERTTETVTNINPDGSRTPVSTTVNAPETTSNDASKPAAEGGKECGTPGRAKCQIDETGMPEAESFDKDKDLKTIEDANKARQEEFDKIGGGGGGGGGSTTPGKSGISNDWFPSIPTTECTNPKVPVPVTGQQLEVNICGPVGIFRSLFTIVFAFFVVMGSVAQIQTAIKA